MMKAQLRRVTQEVGIGEDGNIVEMMRVEFMVGQHGPFAERVPKDQFSELKVREVMDARARTIEALMGL